MNVVIREATIDDIELLVEWRMEVLHDVFSIPQNKPVYELEHENRCYYQRALQNSEHIACFAYLNDTIIGCGGICFYQEMPSPDNPTGKCAYLMNIYTRPQFRKQGVGKELIKWLLEQVTQRNIPKIYLETSEAGKRLYTKMGFLPMQNMMKLPIHKAQE